MTKIIYVVVIAALLSGVLYSQEKVCEYCKKEITSGAYIQVDGKYFHENHFVCANCRKSLVNGSFFKNDNKYYDKKCYDELFGVACAWCGKIIEGAYVTSNGKNYHSHCYENNVALRCDLCGGTISGKYYKDHWGNVYHEAHEHETEKCRFCSRLISQKLTNGGVKYNDGTVVCGICDKNAVKDNNTARKLMNDSMQKLRKYNIIINRKDIGLELTDQNTLQKLFRGANAHTTGFTHYSAKTIDGKIVEQEFKIYCLYGMPIQSYIETISHELMHVWQNINSQQNVKSAFCEGSCNYAAYLIVSELQDEYSEYLIKLLMEEPDPDYGEGFRRVKKLVDNKGLNYWLNHLKANRDFPEGY